MTNCPFTAGDHVMLVDRRGRRYLIQLETAKRFNSHLGHFEHEDVAGQLEGSWIETSKGHLLLAMRPIMSDYTRLMPRIATVVYPKDLGAILINGDLFPGAKVIEAGCGSGAVTIALMRAVGPDGFVFSYDIRQDMVDRASHNIQALATGMNNVSIEVGEVSEVLRKRGNSGETVDRIVLDLPEPWEIVPYAANALVAGGLIVSFLPTVLQVKDLTESLKSTGRFALIDTTESLVRSWTVAKRSIRPDHRMVGHTGFITTARMCQSTPAKDLEDYSSSASESDHKDSSSNDECE